MKNYFPYANYNSKPKVKKPAKVDPVKQEQRLAKRRIQASRWYYKNKPKAFASNGRWAKKALKLLRYEVFSSYGGMCICCGETNYGFLSIDHINRDGIEDRAKHRNRFGQLYSWLKQQGYPRDRYRLLCMNCNWGSRRTGICPHEAVKLVVA